MGGAHDCDSPFRTACTACRRFSLAGCGLNSVPTAEEQVNAAWGNLQADYQRRADLIPNLVNTVKGYAQQEKTVLDRR